MNACKLIAMAAIAIGGGLAMTCANMGGGRIAGNWSGPCHGVSTSLKARDGRVDFRRGGKHWEAPFEAGDENVAKLGKAEIRFHIDALTRDLELNMPAMEPCFLKRTN